MCVDSHYEVAFNAALLSKLTREAGIQLLKYSLKSPNARKILFLKIHLLQQVREKDRNMEENWIRRMKEKKKL
jgi:hypothetical protein